MGGDSRHSGHSWAPFRQQVYQRHLCVETDAHEAQAGRRMWDVGSSGSNLGPNMVP